MPVSFVNSLVPGWARLLSDLIWIQTIRQCSGFVEIYIFCGRPETTKHYLFDCNRYNNLRQEMMQSISQLCEPTLNALLYGVTDLSDETNRQLFIIIQEYIKD